jgi:adenosylhomocysteine nucleosidase
MRAGTGVAAALYAEARSFDATKLRPGAPAMLREGLWLVVTGVGPERARAGALALLRAGAGALVSFGFAAGLAPQLAAGALLLPRRVHAAGGRLHVVDEGLRRALCASLPRGLPQADGDLAETRDPLRDAAAKAALHARLGAVAADMESAALAQAASEAAAPFAVVRAVVDPAPRAIPCCAQRALDPLGGLRLGALCAGLLRRPREVVSLALLAGDFLAARRALAVAAAALAREERA